MSSSFKTLKDFILNSAFYGFAWPFFYNDLEINYFNGDIKNEKIKSINDSIESFKSKETSLSSLDSFTSLFEKDVNLKNFIKDNHSSLPEKVAMFDHAKVLNITN